ncbi:hypothetical protein MMUR_47720 [Mycolicibacterium murale]|uniref:Uncharacterized protein n=1 Tax=Mycolicibacterium murale TaxID=182220 RepID=A0A7I9WTL6_9MYCO|nr:hypothetical protein MMUR_47720 [Mycolicibacterium murale]
MTNRAPRLRSRRMTADVVDRLAHTLPDELRTFGLNVDQAERSDAIARWINRQIPGASPDMAGLVMAKAGLSYLFSLRNALVRSAGNDPATWRESVERSL